VRWMGCLNTKSLPNLKHSAEILPGVSEQNYSIVLSVVLTLNFK
jgi:hypothetical protein